MQPKPHKTNPLLSSNEAPSAELQTRENQADISLTDYLNSSQLSESSQANTSTEIDIIHQRFPYCLVWTPIPFITTFLPTIGHSGICTSSGIIHDFAGSFFVSIDNMAFGKPYKYVLLTQDQANRSDWDRAVEEGDELYNMQKHNLFCNNCHSHCAYVLNTFKYNNKTNYNMFHIWWMLVTKGKYISCGHAIKSYLGFFIIVLIAVGIYFLIKFLPKLPLN